MAQVRAKAATRTCAMTMRTWLASLACSTQYISPLLAVHQPTSVHMPMVENRGRRRSSTALKFWRAILD